MKRSIILPLLLLGALTLSAQVAPLINNNWQTFRWPYNAYYPLDANGPNGHVGNACGHTALARILHYWQFPHNGVGELDFTDYFGNDWYVDFEDLNLVYSQMPYELDWNDPESVYENTAKLFLACGAIGEDIQIGFTDGIFRIPQALEDHLLYSSDMEVLQRWDFTRAEWIAIFKNELENGRPILIDGRTPDSPAPWEPGSWQGHFFVCDGYNAADEFYINYMFGGISGYFDIDSMSTYSAYHRIIVNFEPYNVGMDELAVNQHRYKVFPNPADHQFSIIPKGKLISEADVMIYNTDGQCIHKLLDQRIDQNEELAISTKSLPEGVYFIKIINGAEVNTKKVIVVH